MAFKAKYPGECHHCNRRFWSGTLIEKNGSGWRPVDCPSCEKYDESAEMLRALKKRMSEKHHISYGLWTEGIGDEITSTPSHFMDEAIKLDELSEDDVKLYQFYYHGYMRMDLYD